MNKKTLSTAGLIALGIILVTAVILLGQVYWGMGSPGFWHGSMMGGTGMMGFGLFGFLLMILFWVGVIGLAVWLVSLLFPRAAGGSTPASHGDSNTGESALEILKKRYASGELSRDEYRQMRHDLEHGFTGFADKAG